MAPEPLPHFVLLADPFTLDVESLVAGMDFAWPRSAKVGGLASDSQVPGGSALFLDGEVHDTGLVGLALSGDLEVDTVVAQGCRGRTGRPPAGPSRGPVHLLQSIFSH